MPCATQGLFISDYQSHEPELRNNMLVIIFIQCSDDKSVSDFFKYSSKHFYFNAVVVPEERKIVLFYVQIKIWK